MSANLAMTNGLAAMAYTGATPWHKQGQKMSEGASIDEWKIAAGLEYEVRRSEVRYEANGVLHSNTDKHVLYRSDTSAPLGVVSPSYKIVQPGEVLEFFRSLCSDNGFEMETAGALKGGAVYWALARTGQDIEIKRGDTISPYCLMYSSADGSLATGNQFTSIRVVCQNTLKMARAGEAIKTKHHTTYNAHSVKTAMGLHYAAADSWSQFSDDMSVLASSSMTAAAATAFFAELLRPEGQRAPERKHLGAASFSELLNQSPTSGYTPVKTDRAIRGLAELERCYVDAPGAAPGSAYGVLQAVTRYVDHARAGDADKRQLSGWFGQGAAMKDTAYNRLMTMFR